MPLSAQSGLAAKATKVASLTSNASRRQRAERLRELQYHEVMSHSISRLVEPLSNLSAKWLPQRLQQSLTAWREKRCERYPEIFRRLMCLFAMSPMSTGHLLGLMTLIRMRWAH